ncbi:SLBB domain-containing protein [Bryocella elongata]|uniref:SLBB domain-containing protein n=1 Tax=Bryocella elongata TaxID=863522 RepID=UPI00135CA26D|nr:SLBB domain-containing protein [Bryocella elongata]
MSRSTWLCVLIFAYAAFEAGSIHGQSTSSGSSQQDASSGQSSQSQGNPISGGDDGSTQSGSFTRIGSDLTRPSSQIQQSPYAEQNPYAQQNLDATQSLNRTSPNRNPNQPVELTDFQRLTASSIGKVLPLYGQDLFRNPPSTFAPVSRIPVTPDYVIGPGDELLVRIWGHVTLDGSFTVDRSGSIFIPKVGAIHVAGISYDHLTDFLKSQIGKNFSNFDLNVNVGQLRSIDVFVVGEAKTPGSYTISSLSTLINALFACGGPTPGGSMRNIEVRRKDRVVGTFDFYDLLLKGDKSKDIRLESGDVIYIPPVGPVVALAGSFRHPAIYELKSATSLRDVIRLAGGLSPLARTSDLQVERVRTTEDTRSITAVKLDEGGLSSTLQDGDILEISPIVDRFKEAVTLRGNVADPRRFAWHPGMRIRDLIPNKEALLTRNYWEQRNKLGLPTLDSTPDIRRYAPDQPIAQINGRAVSPSPTALTQSLPNAQDSDTNVYGRQLDVYGREVEVPPLVTTNTTTQGNASQSASRRSQNDQAATLDATSASQPGAPPRDSVSAAVTDVRARFPVRNQVILGAPEIDWSYAVIQRLDTADLSTRLIPFNLGKAILDGDPAQNLELMPGDIVTIFSTADIHVQQAQQTKFVRLEGEFASAGIYRVNSGETLRQLVSRVGLANDAYLYGSEFTRESTRVVQQQRIGAYADDLDQRIKLAEANSANNSLTPQDDVATVAALQNARTVAARLRLMQATGRIVLFIPPGSTNLADIPDLPLEDGDTFTVPQVPATVNVFGAVYNQTSFLYERQHRVKDYIEYAGGGTRTADTHRIYIVRANGLVESKQFSGASLAGSFRDKHLNPGDTIAVPETVDKRPLLRNLVDVATVIGQLGLGVAAINVLK